MILNIRVTRILDRLIKEDEDFHPRGPPGLVSVQDLNQERTIITRINKTLEKLTNEDKDFHPESPPGLVSVEDLEDDTEDEADDEEEEDKNDKIHILQGASSAYMLTEDSRRPPRAWGFPP